VKRRESSWFPIQAEERSDLNSECGFEAGLRSPHYANLNKIKCLFNARANLTLAEAVH